MVDEQLALWYLKMLVVWVLANCALPWYAIWKNKRLKPSEERDEERFKPFVRTDYDNWSYIRCLWTHFFFFPRYLLCLLTMFVAVSITKLICLGVDIENLDETRKDLILAKTCLAMRIFGPLFGCVSFKSYRPKVDYRKWLGPDWTPQYEGATMYVSNHTNWSEVFNTFLFVRPMPGFIAKQGVKEIPSIGAIATSIGTLFLDRQSGSQARQRVFEQIKEKQNLCEQGKSSPLLIFPEACTSNGEYLIAFKKGAFAQLKPVKPYINRTVSPVIKQVMGSVMNLW